MRLLSLRPLHIQPQPSPAVHDEAQEGPQAAGLFTYYAARLGSCNATNNEAASYGVCCLRSRRD